MPAAGTRRYEIDNNQAGRRGVVKTSKREMLTRPSRNDHESGRAFVRGAGPLLHRIALGFAASLLACVTALAQPPLWPMDQWRYPNSGLRDVPPPPAETEPDPADTIPQHLRRQVVSYATREAPGTIVIDTPNTYLYQVQDGGRAIRYGIGVGRSAAASIEQNHDERGIIWPYPIAPFHVHLIPVSQSDKTNEMTARLYGELQAADFEVLWDDRDDRAGVKFNDADLIGAEGIPAGALKLRELFAQADIDGGLIGGASLVAEEFAAICKAL